MKRIVALILISTSCLVFSQSTRNNSQKGKRQQSQRSDEKRPVKITNNRYNSRDAKGVINRGRTFQMGSKIYSSNGNYYLIFQNDGNLVFCNKNSTPIWSSNTQNKGRKAIFQKDGNLVVYNSANTAVFSTNTNSDQNNNKLVVQDDGNLVIYNGYNPLWDLRK